MNHTISDTDYVELSTFAEEQWHKVLNYLGRTFNLPREDCQDVFQDAFIVLYDQINEGRLTPLKCSLSTYFTSICRYKALELLRHNNRSITTDYTHLATDNDTNSTTLTQQACKLASSDPTLANEKEYKLTLVEQIVKRLPSPCKELLWGFYRDGMSMKALAHMHHYSEGAVKVIKHRCCEKFKKQYETTINQTR